jgi:SAM-dependent methyltransferase
VFPAASDDFDSWTARVFAMIPKLLHYTFGMARDFGGKPWSLVHHVCLRSAVERIKPERTYFYCQFEPSGPWWELSRKLVTVVKIEAPREIFGRPLQHVAHQSDVVRLQKLIEYGGIYMDADVFVHRSFDDLLKNSTVLGQEGEGAEHGMANAVILAEPNAPFLRRWLAEYRSFRSNGRDEYWNEHSVQLPVRLAKAYPDEITVLSPKAFFWPLWTDEHLEWIFRSDRAIPLDGVYANHLWESNAWKFIEDMTPGQVRASNTNFNSWAMPFVADLPDTFGAPTLLGRLRKMQYSVSKKAQRKIKGVGRRAKKIALPVSHTLEKLTRSYATESDMRRRTFQEVYQRNLWGSDRGAKFFSGAGSRGDALLVYAQQMADLLRGHCAELGRSLTVVDLGCGDFQVGRALLEALPGLEYVGCDIVPELIAHNNAAYATDKISFRQLDIISDPLPNGDVCLVRQVLQHLSNRDIAAFLERADYRWIYLTEGHPAVRTGTVNPDILAGHDVRFDWRTGRGRGVELDRPPFNRITQEMFRVAASPQEIIVTERVLAARAVQVPIGRMEYGGYQYGG